ncbi:MAG: P22 phage major capsid protein family protein [Steroidobacteraceae bacterium]
MQNIDEIFKNSTFNPGFSAIIKVPPRYLSGTGSTLVKNDTTQTQVTATVVQRNAGVGFTSKQLTLSLGDFKTNVADPLMAQLAADIESDGYTELYNGAQQLVTPGSYTAGAPAQWTGAEINTLRPFNDARARIKDQAGTQNIYAALSPGTQGAVVDNNKAIFNPNPTISDQYLKGVLTRYAGIEFVETQAIPRFVAGTRATTGATVNGTVTSGATSVVLASAGTSLTYVVGDQFTVANVFAVNPLTRVSTGKLQVFTVQTLQTSSGGGAVTLSFLPAATTSGKDQTVNRAITSGDNVTFYGAASVSTEVNLVWDKEAAVFAACDLVSDMDGVKQWKERDPITGVTLRMTSGTDIVEDEAIKRLDVMYTWKTVRPQLVVRVQG